MGYGSGGRYWNVGLSDPGRLAATKRQLFALSRLTGIDHRGRGLTRDEASDLIDVAVREKEARREGITNIADEMYAAMVRKAIAAANEAGAAWLEAHPDPVFGIHDPETDQVVGVHGAVGSAYITWPRSSAPFAKWLAKNVSDGQKVSVPINHRFADRLERDLMFVCEMAAFEVLRSSGACGDIRLIVRSDGIDPALEALAA